MMIKSFNVSIIDKVMECWIEYQGEMQRAPRDIVLQYERVMKSYMEKEVLFIYEIEQECVAYIALSKQLEITCLYVKEEYRHQQIASHLLDHVIKKFKTVHVVLDNGNKAIVDFFAMNGFAIAELREKDKKSHLVMVNYSEVKH